MITSRTGHAPVYVRSGGYYTIPAADYDRVKAEWMQGAAFCETVGIYDDPLTIKLTHVEAIEFRTPESIVQEEEDAEMERYDRIIRGDE